MGRKPLTEAEKEAKMAAKEKLAEEAKAQKEEKSAENAQKKEDDRDAQKIQELEAMVKSLMAQLEEQKRQPSVIQVLGDQEKVVLRFQAEVADDNVALFGPNGMYGQVTGKSGQVVVPKSDWSRFYTGSVRNMMKKRWLIVLSGMTEEERELYGCNYRDGEVLEETVFRKMLDMGNALLTIFPQLCRDHQEMVARRLLSAYQDHDPRVSDRDFIVKLNELSAKETGKGLFTAIIADMNEKDVK